MRLKKEATIQSTPLWASLFLTTPRCSPADLVFFILSLSCSLVFFDFFGLSCYMKISTLPRGYWWCWASSLSHSFCFIWVIFPLFLTSKPPSLPASLCLIFPALCRFFSRCDDAATSDLSLDLRGVALHVSLSAYMCLLVLREDAYPFNMSLAPSLFVVISVTALQRQPSHHSAWNSGKIDD